jgi:hypothetical protein
MNLGGGQNLREEFETRSAENVFLARKMFIDDNSGLLGVCHPIRKECIRTTLHISILSACYGMFVVIDVVYCFHPLNSQSFRAIDIPSLPSTTLIN